ncbi:MAG: ABC transporter ATP-binding protein [Raineya sp.]|jgi:ABC-2 type transport system ATP-binding protein|nr:ABC transporter ATP-binding protein [Raineya sp.]
MNAIEVKNLGYQFSKNQIILQNISLCVPEGSIYGFLGPNGAGKTTTLRLILGLLKKQNGDISILGKALERNRIEVLQKIGSLIETPSIYSHLTAKENLEIWRKIYQCPKNRIEEVLHLVGLEDVGSKKTGQFSLGMKQRIGIAIALLHNPKLLILDEPTNGLDPNGMIEIRDLLKSLNKNYGITILISSHLLSEIEKLTTHIGVIHQGKMKFEGTLEAFFKLKNESGNVKIRTNSLMKTTELLQNYGISVQDNTIEVKIQSELDVASILKTLITNDIAVYEATTNQNNIETVFMNLIN